MSVGLETKTALQIHERVLGTYSGERPGPLLFLVGGIHGNEPAGVHAIRRVFAALDILRPSFSGKVVGLAGNIVALNAEVRYVDEDLNRLWSSADVEYLERSDPASDGPERREQRELITLMEGLIASHDGEVCLLDLHSTSAGGPPFAIMADSIQNRGISFAFDVPVILGLEERVEGTLLAYFSNRGHVAVCLEGGQSDDPTTVEHHEAAIWLALVAAGLMRKVDVPDGERRQTLLAKRGEDLPPVLEVRHRHGIHSGDRFLMRKGFANFDSVERGVLLAHSGGEGKRRVRSPMNGLLLMPLYQGQGNDGFFVGRRVHPFWLNLSAWIRWMPLGWLPPLLPGVERDHKGPSKVLRVDTGIARWLRAELFHLFGYRRSRREGRVVVYVRRPDRFRKDRRRV